MKKVFILTVFCFIIATGLFVFQSCSGSSAESGGDAETISYNFQVRPILSDKCYACHGPDANKREAGLRFDIQEEAYKALEDDPEAHAIVPGKPELSEAYIRVSSSDTSIRMPPASSNVPPLTQEEIAILKKWIQQGAKYEPHWAFVPPQKAAVPKVKNKNWPKNEIDYFVLSKMEEHGLSPNEASDKERLLRRIALDITGLPPTPEMIDHFVNNTDDNAYEKTIDALLQRPEYGERMAIPWLDVARYADSHGYQDDNYRSQWPWRDWVIHAFNNNMPYDQFVTWQLAGDLIPNATKEQILATGFNRNHKITEEGGVIDEEYRVEYVADRTNTLGTAILGMTIECSKCHDHKYDPISQKEYFELSAFFNNIKEVGLESTVGGHETFAKNPRMDITREDLNGVLNFITSSDTVGLQVSVMKDMEDSVRKTYVLTRGEYDQHGEEVQPGTPKAIMAFAPDLPKNRYGLSEWLFDKKNPLTARVFVNRIWQEIFGRGIVKSSNDFGMQGDLPTNPKLLDWLAADFRENGWNIKRLVKQIYMSATYRQSSVITPEKLKIDPQNIYLSYAPRIRMNAEMVRDLALASSGLLKPIIGGPSVKPYQPPGLWELATSGRGLLASYKQDHGDKLYRRGMYTFIKRTVPPPSMIIFDASNRDQCEVKRSRTNTPLQALIMMNDPTILEASVALADYLAEKDKPEAAVTEAFVRIINRHPAKQEQDILLAYLQDQEAYFRSNPAAIESTIKVGEYKMKHTSGAEVAALARLVQVIYNMDEAITKT